FFANRIHLSTHQVDHIFSNAMDLTAAPFFFRAAKKSRKILVIAVQKAQSVWLFLQFVQQIMLWLAIFKHITKITAHEQKIIAPPPAGPIQKSQTMSISVGVASYINRHSQHLKTLQKTYRRKIFCAVPETIQGLEVYV